MARVLDTKGVTILINDKRGLANVNKCYSSCVQYKNVMRSNFNKSLLVSSSLYSTGTIKMTQNYHLLTNHCQNMVLSVVTGLE